MFQKISYSILTAWVLLLCVNQLQAKIVQTSTVDFPVNGKVIVQAREEIGKFPQMIFISKKTGRTLLETEIKDENNDLIPTQDELAPPNLRFRSIESKGFKSPLITAVGVYHGGSDSQYFMNVFGEIKGKIILLNEQTVFSNIQGGYYFGYLNKKFGYGLVAWNFIWGGDEGHYSSHHYQITVYKLQNGKFKERLENVTRKKYESRKNADSLREIGIKANDQRFGIPKIGRQLRIDL